MEDKLESENFQVLAIKFTDDDETYTTEYRLKTKMPYAEWCGYCSKQDNITLVKLAIEKWTLLRDAVIKYELPVSDGGTTTCPLCRAYFDNDCSGCPIYDDTGFEACSGTHYEDYEPWSYTDDEDMTPEILETGIKYLQEEVSYLTGLLHRLEEEK